MTSIPDSILTPRLLLRRPRPSDAEAVFAYAGDPEVTHFMDWSTHRSMATVVEYLQGCALAWTSGEEFTWIIVQRADELAIGGISLRIHGHKADFGYVLNKRYFRQGFGTEASRAVVDLAASLPGMRRIWATCDIENVASARVLEKSGLAREGVFRSWQVRPNISMTPRDALVYAKIVGSDRT